MAAAEARAEAMDKILRTPYPRQQLALRQPLRGADDYVAALRHVYFQNPFFKLTDDEAEALVSQVQPEALSGLIEARHQAMRAQALKYVVFCMPKSGSSFLKSALQHALQLPFFSLTSFGNGQLSSHFGMNPREQEIDELALIKAALSAPHGFVAQHHTRYTLYLALQIGAYRLKPVVTVRNILDALVSFDDMMIATRATEGQNAWVGDAPFALPLGYHALAPETRYRLLGPSLGVWLVQFHLSWVRGLRQAVVEPLLIRYEEDILDPPRLIARLTEALALNELQAFRLREFVARPDPARSRFNVGRAGRGREAVPDDVRDFLLNYARNFEGELPDEEIAYLLG
jgi:hypothetical protein